MIWYLHSFAGYNLYSHAVDTGSTVITTLKRFFCLYGMQMWWWEAVLLLLLYVCYVFVTFLVSKGDEPVHADRSQREVPPEEDSGES